MKNTGSKTTSTTAALVVDENTDRTAITLFNADATDTIYIGADAGVSSTTGYALLPKLGVQLSATEGFNSHLAVYAIAGANTPRLHWIEGFRR